MYFGGEAVVGQISRGTEWVGNERHPKDRIPTNLFLLGIESLGQEGSRRLGVANFNPGRQENCQKQREGGRDDDNSVLDDVRSNLGAEDPKKQAVGKGFKR